MKEIIFIIGGCKSGKSRYALELARRSAAPKKIFIATGIAFDDEMKDRIRRHRMERGAEWLTVEAPVELAEAVLEHNKNETILLVDCLTLWINNLLMENRSPLELAGYADDLIQTLASAKPSVILVSNEVGAGIVPENALARRFRDIAGTVNQKVASCADHVFWMVAGMPVKVK